MGKRRSFRREFFREVILPGVVIAAFVGGASDSWEWALTAAVVWVCALGAIVWTLDLPKATVFTQTDFEQYRYHDNETLGEIVRKQFTSPGETS